MPVGTSMRLTILLAFQTLEGLVASQGISEQFRRQVVGKFWNGYSINGQWVFMSYYTVIRVVATSTTSGLCNTANDETRMYYNGGVRISAKNHNELTGNGTRIYGTEATINYTNSQADWWKNNGSIQEYQT